jgi:hypothetical protein
MSRTYEIEWDDLAEFAVVCYAAGGLALTTLFYEKMEEVAQKQPDNPRTAWFTRPAIAAAKQVGKFWNYLDKNEGVGVCCAIGCGLVGVGAGITAICLAWPWLGATWAGLLTLKGIGLGLGALGIGAAVVPVAAAATVVTTLLIAPCAAELARGWHGIKSEMIVGRAETKAWKLECKAAKGGPPKPHPLAIAAEMKKEEMTAQGACEREQLFRRLQAKFPDEFAEAVRRTDTDTVLRNKVQVMKPLKIRLQAKKKTFAERFGGAA